MACWLENPFNTAFESFLRRKETAALCCGYKLVHHRRFSSHAFWLIDYLRHGACSGLETDTQPASLPKEDNLRQSRLSAGLEHLSVRTQRPTGGSRSRDSATEP